MLYKIETVSGDLSLKERVTIETNISDKGLPIFEIFGLVNKTIEESKKRVITAFENSGLDFPLKNIRVNIAPAGIFKNGTHYDFPLCMSIIKSISNLDTTDSTFLGELSFDGEIRGVRNIQFLIFSAVELGFKKIFFSVEDVEKVIYIDGIEYIPIKNLKDLLSNDFKKLTNFPDNFTSSSLNHKLYPSISGSNYLKKITALSLIGKHHLLMIGSPGMGKSLHAKSMSEINTLLTLSEYIDVAKIYSYIGEGSENLSFQRPFRSPHSSSSYSSIFGSVASRIYPGEVTLANKGILFLDELPEFNRLVLEGLRAPLEDRRITLSRAQKKIIFETDFLLVAAMNPCKCGYFYSSKIECSCSPRDIKNYRQRISGPILDRIDLIVNIDKVRNYSMYEKNNYSNLSYPNIINLVSELTKIRNELIKPSGSYVNKLESMDNIITHKYISNKLYNFLISESEKYSLSKRSLNKILNISLTLSLLDGRSQILDEHVIEAIELNRFT